MSIKPISRKSNIVVQEIADEVMVYDLNINKAFCLNETSAIVWQLSDGENTVSEIVGKMSRQLKLDVSEDLVWLALDQLGEDGLLENDEIIPRQLSGVSRRELIKKAGIASAVALPIVLSIAAPKAAHAQSCVADFAACTPPQTCCTPALLCGGVNNNCCIQPFSGACTANVECCSNVCLGFACL